MSPSMGQLRRFHGELAKDYNASTLVGTGLEVKLAGQQGVGLFANKAMQGFERRDNETLRLAVKELHPAKQGEFKLLPVRGDVDRTSLLSIFRVTAFCPLSFLSSCYNIFATMNPSCRPNLHLLLHQTKNYDFAIFLVNDVKAGEEPWNTETHSICCMTTAQRQEFFTDPCSQWPYQCRCELCTAPPSVRQISDRRRNFMRHLHYLINGRDLPDAPPTIRGLRADAPGSRLRAWHKDMFDKLAEAEGTTWMTHTLK
ncbi:uncharacterized protein K489DRAFT_413732 [Dissoconium aciculare CBS 342.82]|uniref:SET domain-containing protein n=1 Tax=Dissoconium aciculare CBS 342.82 TaxID=1314786 RepID=A0A6J3LS45_9PEZI|nr:uncharacterized protein K489DRAFT_413732 [Dissoconium aciculare CBS 342.82]KAF1818443.1 hypothetical protein K489DRAFT_413732 [Dissoconium aciculare CBS 342.82]